MVEETWKICGDYPMWAVSTLGNLKWVKTLKKVYTRVEKRGYVVAQVTLKGNVKTVKVHRLVATAFLDNTENKPCVNHKDTCKTNNNVDNLEWCTHSENNKHARDNGLVPMLLGSMHGRATINEDLVHLICKDYVNGLTAAQVIKKYGVTRNQAAKLKHKTTWSHITSQYNY